MNPKKSANSTEKVCTTSTEKIYDEILTSVLSKESQKVVIIGIDGPTAVGKTIFADAIASSGAIGIPSLRPSSFVGITKTSANSK